MIISTVNVSREVEKMGTNIKTEAKNKGETKVVKVPSTARKHRICKCYLFVSLAHLIWEYMFSGKKLKLYRGIN